MSRAHPDRKAPALLAFGAAGMYVLVAGAAVGLRLHLYRMHVPEVEPLRPIGLLGAVLLLFAVLAVVGARIVSRNNHPPVGWLMISVALVVAVEWFAKGFSMNALSGSSTDPPLLPMLAALVAPWLAYVVLAVGLVVLPLLYRDGRLSSWWGRFLVGGAGLVVATIAVKEVTGPTLVGTLESTTVFVVTNPAAVPALHRPLSWAPEDVLAIFVVAALATATAPFLHSRYARRQQTT